MYIEIWIKIKMKYIMDYGEIEYDFSFISDENKKINYEL